MSPASALRLWAKEVMASLDNARARKEAGANRPRYRALTDHRLADPKESSVRGYPQCGQKRATGVFLRYVFLLTAFTSAVAASQPFTLQVLSRLQILDGATISPDGLNVLVSVHRMRPVQDDVERTLWLMSADTGEKREVARDLLPDTSQALWSPDGSRIAFVAGTLRNPELVVLDVNSGQRKLLIKDNVEGYAWSPTGDLMAAVVAPLVTTKQEADLRIADEPVVARNRLLLLDAKTGNIRELADDLEVDPFAPSWSPDSTKLAFSASDDLYVIDVKSTRWFALVKRPGVDRHPVWSPNGKTIAFSSQYGESRGPHFLSLVEAAVGSIPRDGYQTLDPGFGSDDPRFFVWSRDSRSIYVSVLSHMRQRLVRLDLTEGSVTVITVGDSEIYYNFSSTADGGQFACIASSPEDPGSLVVSPFAEFVPRRLRWNYPELIGVNLGHMETVDWMSTGGLHLEGLLLTPSERGINLKPYPLVILTEGSHGTFDLSFTTRVSADSPSAAFPFEPHVLAGKGYAVFMPNVRGSWGFGENLRSLVWNDPAKGPYEDLMSGIDSLVNRGVVDPQRIAIMGIGFDAYRAAYALTKTHRFRAAVLGEPFGIDLISFFSDPFFGSWVETSLGGTPWDKPALYTELSPLLNASAITTPVQLFCMESDRPLAVQQCHEFHRALDRLKIPNQLILIAQTASFFGGEKVRSYLDLMDRSIQWIDRRLGTAEITQ